MTAVAIVLLAIQGLLLGLFSIFAFFNYLYGIASLWHPRIRRVEHSGRRIAVVIVSFNEEHVLERTISACDRLSYPNKVIVLADDSSDARVVNLLRELAVSRGCRPVVNHAFVQELSASPADCASIEIWQSPEFVFFHRPSNLGFKGGSLRKVEQYLQSQNIDLMYLLDADWHPQPDALERTLEVLEGDDRAAFIQTKRLAFPHGMNLFQKYVALLEEGCYYVDFEGRQVLHHPILFSGCCTLFRMDAVSEAGGFTSGHLTEDLDLTDRLWLKGWKGIYLGNVVNYGEVPFTYDDYRRQQERWAAGSTRAFKDFAWRILRSSEFGWFEKIAALRQNAYYTTTLLTGVAILLGITTVLWLAMAEDSYETEYYLYSLGIVRRPYVMLLYWCILSNLVEPLVMILFKKRNYRWLLHLPMMIWYAWSVIPTYIMGNVKGLIGANLDWFRTPKFDRADPRALAAMPFPVRLFNLAACAVLFGFYFLEGSQFGWFDDFALLLIPAFLLAAIRG